MKNKKHTPLLAALATLVVLLAGVVLIWLAKVRPDVGKGRSEIVTDFLRAELLQDGQTATQVFTYDKDILTIGLEFYLPGDQPCGALDVVLYDADTGEELSRSVGTMDYIVPDQYTTLGMDPAVTGRTRFWLSATATVSRSGRSRWPWMTVRSTARWQCRSPISASAAT